MVIVLYDTQRDEVVLHFTEGSQEAFRELYLKYKDGAFRVILRYVQDREAALDLLQDTFVKVYEFREKIRAEAEFHKLLFSIAINTSIDWLRRERKFRKVSIHDDEHPVSWSLADGRADHAKVTELRAMQADVDEALAACPEHEKQSVVLKLSNELTFAEVAETLGISTRTAKRYVKSGLERVSRILEARGYRMPGEANDG